MSLVVTIIILLILAGISIKVLTGSGLIEKAKEAKERVKNAEELENEILKSYEDFENIDDKSNNNGNNNGNDSDSNYSIGEEKDKYSIDWRICDGSILKLSDYPILGKNRSDLIINSIDVTPTFTSPNARVKSSGSADGNWPAYLVFSPTLVSSAGSGWISQGGSGPKWISVDMEKNTNINKIEITNVNHQNMLNSVGAPIDFSIKGSFDDITYNEILNVTGNEHLGMGETYSYTFDEVLYRYYKIEITNGLPWWDGNQYYGFRSWKLLLDGEHIKLPNDPSKVIKVK